MNCPNCESKNVHETELEAEAVDETEDCLIVEQEYECQECGFLFKERLWDC